MRNKNKAGAAVYLLVMGILLFAVGAPALAETIFVAPIDSGPLPGTETRITTNLSDQFDPAISGDIVVYTDLRGVDSDIYYFDTATGVEVQVTSLLGNQQLTDVSGSHIVFTDSRRWDVYAYSMETATSTNFTSESTGAAMDPAVGKRLVAWVDRRDGNQEIYARNMAAGEERRISNNLTQDSSPAVDYFDDKLIVWQRCDELQCDIWSYDWASMATRQITSTLNSSERLPGVYNNLITYESVHDDGEWDVCVTDITQPGIEKCLALPGQQTNPNISGEFIVFETQEGDFSRVCVWNLPTNQVFRINTAPAASKYLNDIDGNRIVYTDNRGGQLDIYLYTVAPVLSYAGIIELPKTGQTTSYVAGDDGDLETGVAWPNPRFTDIGDSTIKDELTGLVWSKNANLPNGSKTWQQALDYVAGMNAGTYPNFGYTDWRLPNVNELRSLIDNSRYNPALPSGHPFTNVQSYYYWSSTT